MEYTKVEKGIFLSRPNRFLAKVRLGGGVVECHVKNTGRCRELLVPGVEVYLQKEDNPNRKTKYSLIHVRKGERLVNIDSQAPNRLEGVAAPMRPVSRRYRFPAGKNL